MARMNAVNRGKGVEFNGKLVSPRLIAKKVDKMIRLKNKSFSINTIAFGGVQQDNEKQIVKNLKYLNSKGLLI